MIRGEFPCLYRCLYVVVGRYPSSKSIPKLSKSWLNWLCYFCYCISVWGGGGIGIARRGRGCSTCNSTSVQASVVAGTVSLSPVVAAASKERSRERCLCVLCQYGVVAGWVRLSFLFFFFFLLLLF